MTEHSDALSQALRAALRAGDPGEDFTRTVMTALDAPAAGRRSTPRPPWRAQLALALVAGLAGALAVAVGIVQTTQARRAEQAREQTLLALEIASHQLNDARRMVIGDDGSD